MIVEHWRHYHFLSSLQYQEKVLLTGPSCSCSNGQFDDLGLFTATKIFNILYNQNAQRLHITIKLLFIKKEPCWPLRAMPH
mmetsp:Transcript_31916/g.48469  ORF Transcript_31916/g.48469 Transcript_31916/m.48469 type:complete len:81 (-) Transcript_31916:17-259(-)